MGKKGFIKTMEIMFVIIISVFFLISVIPRQFADVQRGTGSYLINMEKDPTFRSFLDKNYGCYNTTQRNVITSQVEMYLPQVYSYIICTGPSQTSLPDRDISIDTLFYAGNYTVTSFKTIKLYYWLE